MALNTAFTTGGSNPFATTGFLNKSSSLGTQTTTPSGISSAPISVKTTSPRPTTSGLMSPAYSSNGTPNFTPSTPVKSITTPAGVTTTFHAPGTDSKGNNSPGTGGATGAGMLNSNYSGFSSAPNPSVSTQPVNNTIDYSGTNQGNINPPQTLTNSQPNQTQPYAPNPALQGQLITGLANMSQQPSQEYTDQINQANAYNQALLHSKQNQADMTKNILNQPSDIAFQTGEVNNVANKFLAEQQALSGAYQGASNLVGQANTQQGLNQSALTGAVSGNAPQFPSYASQVYSPSSGFQQGGNTLNDAVSTIAQRVQSGQMSYDQAVSSLSGYGQGGVNALQQALGPNFNVAQSNTLASQQGSIGPALQYANTALNNLQNAVGNLPNAQSTNIPILNQITQGFSTTVGVGSEAVQNYRAAVAEARSAIQKVLASVSGGTPTDYVGQSNALLPDNATPNQVKAAIDTLQTLGTAKASIYGNPGLAGTKTQTSTSKTSSSLYSW